MRRTALLILLLASATLILFTGCNQRSGSSIGNRVGVALTVNGGSSPSAQQTQLILTSIRPELERQGFIIVTDLNQADRIIRVDFTPDEFFPEIAGSAVVLGWRVNPAIHSGYGSGSYAYQPFLNAYYASNYGYDRYSYDYTRYDSRGYDSSTPPHNSKGPNDGSSTRPENRNRDHARRDGDRDGDRDADKSDRRRDGDKGDRNGDRDGDHKRGNDHNRDNRPPPGYDRPQPTYASSPSNSGYSSGANYSSSNSSSYNSSSSSSGSYSSGSSSYSSSSSASSSSSYSPPSSSSSSPSHPTVANQNE